MDDAARAYWDEVSESNARRSKDGGGEPEKVDPERTKEKREEAWWFWVKQKIRRVVGVAAKSESGELTVRGRMVIYKPITGDPLIDGENGHENAVEVFVPD